MRATRPVMDRIMARVLVEVETGCWFYFGHVGPGGYCATRVGPEKRTDYVHRITYTHLVGPIPDGLQIDHLCRNRRCCNPAHLEPVTSRVNLLRGDTLTAQNAVKTHCKRGHEFTPENTYRQRGQTTRACVVCRRASSAVSNARVKAALLARRAAS